MPQLIAEASFRYATRPLKPGDAFEASEKDANILKLAGRARDAGQDEPQPEPKRTRRYQRRDMTAEE